MNTTQNLLGYFSLKEVVMLQGTKTFWDAHNTRNGMCGASGSAHIAVFTHGCREASPHPQSQFQGWHVHHVGLSWCPRSRMEVHSSTFHFAQNLSPKFMVKLIRALALNFLSQNGQLHKEGKIQTRIICSLALLHREEWAKGLYLPEALLCCCYDLWFWLLMKSFGEWSETQVWTALSAVLTHYSKADRLDSSSWKGCTLIWEH